MHTRPTIKFSATRALRYTLGVLLVLTLLVGCGGQSARPMPSVTAAASVTSAPAPTTLQPTSPTATAAPPSAATATLSTTATFQNPVFRTNFADPFVLKVGSTYYGYATGSAGRNIQAATSPDMLRWTLLTDAMPALPAWVDFNEPRVWAPEVLEINNRYLLYYTAHDKTSDKQCIGVAVSDKPQGKFRDSSRTPLVCQSAEGGSIDPSPFQDGDQLFLYWKNDGNCCGQPTYLYVQPLAPDGLSLSGEATRLVRNDQPWEGRIVEAPTMIKRGAQYYLFFSANDYAGFEYAVGYATCVAPVGPCQDAAENPILASLREQPLVVGPGHQTVIQIGDETWLIYHVWEVSQAGLRTDRRFMYLDRIAWIDGKPDVLGPTTQPQPQPQP